MLAALKHHWRVLRAGRPGRRFEDRYDAARAARRDGSWIARSRRLLRLLLALLLIVVGVFEAFLPGPAVLFIFFAGSLLSAESRTIARCLDWAEVRSRSLGRRAGHHWGALPAWGKVGLGAVIASLGASGAYAAYIMMG